MAETVNDEEAIQLKRLEGQRDPRNRGPLQSGEVESAGDGEDGRSLSASLEEPAIAVARDVVSEKAYSSFTPREKWGIIVLISMASIFSYVLVSVKPNSLLIIQDPSRPISILLLSPR